jgi:hypothetical protein
MRASFFYRAAAALLLLFAALHSIGFNQSDPSWGVDGLLASMRNTRFDMMGFRRSYWDLFLAAGYSLGLLYLLASVLAWQLAGLASEILSRMRLASWAFAACFAAVTVVSSRYLFVVPIALSAAITLCLAAAAWLGGRRIG